MAVVRLANIRVSFVGVPALRGVDLDLEPGEVHAVVGENGAGKSTLMRVLAGVVARDAGTIELAGELVEPDSPRAARILGIAMVHQETSLFGQLTVAENIAAGRLPTRRLGLVDRDAMADRAAAVLRRFRVSIRPTDVVDDLSAGQRQIVEIAHAVAYEARVLILDEPTSALTLDDASALFELIRQVRDSGMAVVYISHRIEEVFAIADRITVLRDGERVVTVRTQDTDRETIIRSMIGRTLDKLYGQRSTEIGEVVLSVEGLSQVGRFADVSLSVRAGEIVGLAGLVGSGRTEVALAIFGRTRPDRGHVAIAGQTVAASSPAGAISAGIAYVTEDRHGSGLFMDDSIEANVIVTQLDRLTRGGMLSASGSRRLAHHAIDALGIRAYGPGQRVRTLSGGNQQKVLLAKWLELPLRVLIVDEPTKGIDVGAKLEIYRLLRSLAASGLGILMISSEMTEVIGMSDRVIVMHDGRIAGELAGADISEERILRLAAGQAQKELVS